MGVRMGWVSSTKHDQHVYLIEQNTWRRVRQVIKNINILASYNIKDYSYL